MYLFYFIIISLWKRTWPFIRTSLNPHCAKLGRNRPSACGEENFPISSVYFCYFVIMFPLKGVWPFIWINLNIPYPRMYCVYFGWNCGSGEEDENVKSLQTDRQTHGRHAIRKAHNGTPSNSIIFGFNKLFKHGYWILKNEFHSHRLSNFIQEKHDNSQTIT